MACLSRKKKRYMMTITPQQELRCSSKRKRKLLALRVMNSIMKICSALMLWKLATVATQTDCPLLVHSSSGYQTFVNRGDLLFLHNTTTYYTVGDLIAYRVENRTFTIVHRIVSYYHSNTNITSEERTTHRILTKGDDNRVDDRGLYLPGQMWLSRKEVVGKVVAIVPFAGMIPIILQDSAFLKYALILIGGCWPPVPWAMALFPGISTG